MAETDKVKRKGGQTMGENWLVLTESTQGSDTSWKHKCGAVILCARVAHTVRDGFFTLSGSGKCEYEEVPYCPECEEKPSFHGTPIFAK